MEAFFIRTIQLLLSLSILVLLHELGHFAFSRLFKVRVDKFYMFFNPQISIIRAKKINGKWRVKLFAKNVPANERTKLDEDGNPVMNGKAEVLEPVPLSDMSKDDWRRYPEKTEWGIGWVPLGGYCKISGMIDESMDKTQLSAPPQPWEFRSRSPWQRLPIILGGIVVNFLLALVIYSAVIYVWGKEYIPLENAKYGLSFSPEMQSLGFKNGDKILKIDEIVPETYQDIAQHILYNNESTVSVQRGDSVFSIKIPSGFEKKVIKSETSPIEFNYPFVIDNVANNSAAEKAKLTAGDSIVGVNHTPMTMYADVKKELDLNKDKSIQVDYVRDGKLYSTTLQLSQNGKMGVGLRSPYTYLETKKETFGFFSSFPEGIKMGTETLVGYVKSLKLIFSKEGASQLGGFGTIGKLFPTVWDWQAFWMMTAFLSIILAVMNFLPIPGLDGGYVLFLIYEIVTGRKPSQKFMETAVSVGMIFLLLLLVYANGNDILRMFK